MSDMPPDRPTMKEKYEKIFNDENYTYVFASTLNQMVNYIPIKMFDLKNLCSVTLIDSDGKKLKDNQKWDYNLEHVLNGTKPDYINIKQTEFLKISKAIEKFGDKFTNKKVVWNITGGQRPYLLAVLEFTKGRPDDYIMYLEGNTGQISIAKADEYGQQDKESLGSYAVDDLTIETALKLMGYKPQSTFASITINQVEQDFWINTFYDKYIQSKTLRENLVMLNKTQDNQGKTINKNTCWQNIYQELGMITQGNPYLEAFSKEFNNPYPFGYILEKMVFYVLNKEFQSKVQQIYASLRTYANGSQTDEFDIVILTKQGQIINFECKSGIMDSDVAKSTKYSTYAIAGVYGLPILITPLLDSEFSTSLRFPFDKSDEAMKAAQKANLEIWGIDKIVENLKRKLK